MLNIFLIVQVIVSVLLILVILLQKTSSDGVSTLSGSNMGLVGINTANQFLVKTTIILAIVFAINLLLTANYFSNLNKKNNLLETPPAVKMEQ
ncbi:MAG: preprotein translocase subunit SecG [Rickettsiales bacterium]